MFDWPSFLSSRGFSYMVKGEHPRLTKDNILIECPFCDEQPTGPTMSISTAGRGWMCWRRRSEHKGGSPVRLIQALTGCSFGEAKAIAGQAANLPLDLSDAVAALLEPAREEAPRKPLKLPAEFRSLDTQMSSALPYMNYLIGRGFTRLRIYEMTRNYDVCFCNRGSYKGRIIFPIYFEGKLVSWTSRTISKQEGVLRYKALSTDPDKAAEDGYKPALRAVNSCLLWYDDIMQRASDYETLIITEGPFDALKTAILGHSLGVMATCVFTNDFTPQQMELLRRIIPRFKRRYIMLDQGTLSIMLRLSSELATLGLERLMLPSNIKDPGLLTKGDLERLLR